jgi:regulator of nonsense transcripts 2
VLRSSEPWKEESESRSPEPSKALDSSLKKHTALIKRMKLSIGAENRDQILRDIEGLALEKYVDELAGAAVEGVGRCKTERDVWSAAEVRASRVNTHSECSLFMC